MLEIVLERPGRFVALDGSEPAAAGGHALVRVHRIGVCGTDLHAYRGRQPFFTYPRVLGHELGIEVLDPGREAGRLRAGDRCAVEPYLNCGACIACRHGRPNCCATLQVLGVHRDGGMRALLQIPATKLHPSRALSYDQLALVETLAIGAHAVERAEVRPGEFVLVIGAGPIGVSAAQFALNAGARVAVMDTSRSRLELCGRRMNLACAIDGASAAIAEELLDAGDGDLPTVVFDATGNAASMSSAYRWPAPGGRLVLVGLVQADVTFSDPEFHRKELTILASRNARPESFRAIISTIERGGLDTSWWVTHHMDLPDVPDRFERIAADPTLFKAMISVPLAGSSRSFPAEMSSGSS